MSHKPAPTNRTTAIGRPTPAVSGSRVNDRPSIKPLDRYHMSVAHRCVTDLTDRLLNPGIPFVMGNDGGCFLATSRSELASYREDVQRLYQSAERELRDLHRRIDPGSSSGAVVVGLCGSLSNVLTEVLPQLENYAKAFTYGRAHEYATFERPSEVAERYRMQAAAIRSRLSEWPLDEWNRWVEGLRDANAVLGATVLEAVPDLPASRQASAKRSAKAGKVKGKMISERMMKELMAARGSADQLQELIGRSASAWADRLGCAPATVCRTSTWRTLMDLRETQKLERIADDASAIG